MRWQFVVGIVMAALGGYLVVKFKPEPAPSDHGKKVATVDAPKPE
jgi:hypothetical protein